MGAPESQQRVYLVHCRVLWPLQRAMHGLLDSMGFMSAVVMAFKDDEHTGMFQNTTLNKHCAKLSRYTE